MVDFEYEERYRADDPAATQQQLEDAGFILTSTQEQIDHWFIPTRISSPDEQAHWFDHEGGYALRIREESMGDMNRTLITVKQALRGADHSALSNLETELTTEGLLQAFERIGTEFGDAAAQLRTHAGNSGMTVQRATQLIVSAGRKEYLTIHKQRSTFSCSQQPDVVADIDTIPALRDTTLGFSAQIEFEYKGAGSLEDAERAISAVTRLLGYGGYDQLAKALPGLAIPYLAKF